MVPFLRSTFIAPTLSARDPYLAASVFTAARIAVFYILVKVSAVLLFVTYVAVYDYTWYIFCLTVWQYRCGRVVASSAAERGGRGAGGQRARPRRAAAAGPSCYIAGEAC